MPTLLAPGVYLERRQATPQIPAVRTDVAAFVGLAERGPLRIPARVQSWEEFRTTFGGFVPGAYLAYAVRAFFENGGRTCYVVRVAAPQAMSAGAMLTDATGTAAFEVRASSEGSWGNALAVRLVRSSRAATRATPGRQPVDPAASRVDSVTGIQRGSLVRIRQDGGPTTFRVVTSIDAISNILLWDAPLDPAYDPTLPLSFETVELTVQVLEGGVVAGELRNLPVARLPGDRSPLPLADDGGLILLDDLRDTVDPAALHAGTAADLTPVDATLTGGIDGLAQLAPDDFIAGLEALEPIDEPAIVAVPDILIRPEPPPVTDPEPKPEPDPCAPGPVALPPAAPPATVLPEQPPTFTLGQVFAVQQALVANCEKLGDRIALLDPPLGPGETQAVDLGEIQSWRERFDSTYAALYYPWILAYDPLHVGGAIVRALPPSGHIAGVFANTDLTVGVHVAPANVELTWAQGTTIDLSEELQEILNPIGVNCIRTFPGRGIRVYGARTVSSDPSWRFVNVRRLLMAIEKSVSRGIQWSAFEPIDAYLRQKLAMSISGLLERMWERGAFAGPTTQTSYFVKSDDDNNPPMLADEGELVVDVGVAATKPSEFVVFRISRTENELEIVE